MSRSKFKRPSKEVTKRHLGDISGLSKTDKKFFSLEYSKCIKKLPKPGPSDWLFVHEERGQSFKQFKNSYMCAKPHATFKTIYVQPIGKLFNSTRVVKLDIIREYIESFFFGLSCKILPVMSLEKAKKIHNIKTRNQFGNVQILTGDVIDFLNKDKKRKVKKNKNRLRTEVCCIAITWPYDLYPSEDWNFVFGIAHIMDCLGVYSFARLDPNFPDLENGDEPSEKEKALILKRSLNIVSHELTHLFGIKHCIHFHCLENGCNHQEESDNSPLFLCPCCMKKLHESLKFNISKRYIAMYKFFLKYGMKNEVVWIENRFLECLGKTVEEVEKIEKENEKIVVKKGTKKSSKKLKPKFR